MLFNFVICEDMKFWRTSYKKVIQKVAEELHIKFEIYEFEKFNQDFIKIMNSNLENKIYILDLLMPEIEGTEVARLIRESDLVSFIIFITSYYDDYQDEINDGEYCYLKYINKADDYESILFNTLVKNIDKKCRLENIVIPTEHKLFYIVPHSITQIYTKERRIIMENSISDPVNIPMTLEKIKSYIPNYFKYSKNCCIINTSRIVNIDKKKKVITFDDGSSTNLVSRKYLKVLLSDFENKKEPSRS